MLSQTEIAGTLSERAGGEWVGHPLGPESILAVPEIGIEVSLAEIYGGVPLAPPEEDAEAVRA